jgi:hypothetical protein
MKLTMYSQEHVRDVVKKSFDIEQDTDIVVKPSADRASVRRYNDSADGMEGPDSTKVEFDMLGPVNSLWNRRVVEILRAKFRDLEDEEEWGLPIRTNFYIEEMFQARFIRLRGCWRNAQCRLKEDGQLETEEEWEARMEAEELEDKKEARHLTRRIKVSEKLKRTTPSKEMIEIGPSREDRRLHDQVRRSKAVQRFRNLEMA